MNIIGIAAGKGGVGKSTVTVNLAFALQRLGKKVGILDADLYGPSIRHMMPEDRLPERSPENPQKILPAECCGIKIISMSYFREEGEASIIRAPKANAAIEQFLHHVDWGNLDILLVDFPPGTGDIQLSLAQGVKFVGAILVTLPQKISLIDVRKAVQLFEQAKIPILGIVENMHMLFSGDAGEALSKEIGAPLLAKIPFDSVMSECADAGKNYLDNSSGSVCKDAFLHLAETVGKEIFRNCGDSPAITIKGRNVLLLEWPDGLTQEILAKNLQKNCLCIRCQDKMSDLYMDTEIIDVQSVGGYAFKFTFNQGCSQGVYPMSMLRSLKGSATC